MRALLRATTLVLGAVVIGLGIWHAVNIKKQRFSDPGLPDFGAVKPFTLIERSSATVTLDDLKGRPWVANFIFTRCMGPCPLMTMRMSELQKQYMATTDLQFVSFSVDPVYDTPAVLTAFSAPYKPDPKRWYFLTGSEKEMHDVIMNNFHLAIEQEGGQINHSLHFVLVDRTGRIRGYYNGSDAEAMARLHNDIRTATSK
jgi:protein SCO1/2